MDNKDHAELAQASDERGDSRTRACALPGCNDGGVDTNSVQLGGNGLFGRSPV